MWLHLEFINMLNIINYTNEWVYISAGSKLEDLLKKIYTHTHDEILILL